MSRVVKKSVQVEVDWGTGVLCTFWTWEWKGKVSMGCTSNLESAGSCLHWVGCVVSSVHSLRVRPHTLNLPVDDITEHVRHISRLKGGTNTVCIQTFACSSSIRSLKCLNIKRRMNKIIQSTLSKVDTLGTKATVQFREVSGLESVRLERVDCIQNVSYTQGRISCTLVWNGLDNLDHCTAWQYCACTRHCQWKKHGNYNPATHTVLQSIHDQLMTVSLD